MEKSTQQELQEEPGATMIEYVFLLSMLVLIAIAAVRFFGHTVSGQFSAINNSVDFMNG